MNIVDKVQALLESFPKISELTGTTVHIDYTDSDPASYGLSSTGDTLLSEDVLGNQLRQHSFMFYAMYSSVNDYERLSNSSVLLELGQWLERQVDCDITTTIGENSYTGKLRKITTSNGMLIAVPQGDMLDGVQYQLQILAEYTVDV